MPSEPFPQAESTAPDPLGVQRSLLSGQPLIPRFLTPLGAQSLNVLDPKIFLPQAGSEFSPPDEPFRDSPFFPDGHSRRPQSQTAPATASQTASATPIQTKNEPPEFPFVTTFVEDSASEAPISEDAENSAAEGDETVPPFLANFVRSELGLPPQPLPTPVATPSSPAREYDILDSEEASVAELVAAESPAPAAKESASSTNSPAADMPSPGAASPAVQRRVGSASPGEIPIADTAAEVVESQSEDDRPDALPETIVPAELEVVAQNPASERPPAEIPPPPPASEAVTSEASAASESVPAATLPLALPFTLQSAPAEASDEQTPPAESTFQPFGQILDTAEPPESVNPPSKADATSPVNSPVQAKFAEVQEEPNPIVGRSGADVAPAGIPPVQAKSAEVQEASSPAGEFMADTALPVNSPVSAEFEESRDEWNPAAESEAVTPPVETLSSKALPVQAKGEVSAIAPDPPVDPSPIVEPSSFNADEISSEASDAPVEPEAAASVESPGLPLQPIDLPPAFVEAVQMDSELAAEVGMEAESPAAPAPPSTVPPPPAAPETPALNLSEALHMTASGDAVPPLTARSSSEGLVPEQMSLPAFTAAPEFAGTASPPGREPSSEPGSTGEGTAPPIQAQLSPASPDSAVPPIQRRVESPASTSAPPLPESPRSEPPRSESPELLSSDDPTALPVTETLEIVEPTLESALEEPSWAELLDDRPPDVIPLGAAPSTAETANFEQNPLEPVQPSFPEPSAAAPVIQAFSEPAVSATQPLDVPLSGLEPGLPGARESWERPLPDDNSIDDPDLLALPAAELPEAASEETVPAAPGAPTSTAEDSEEIFGQILDDVQEPPTEAPLETRDLSETPEAAAAPESAPLDAIAAEIERLHSVQEAPETPAPSESPASGETAIVPSAAPASPIQAKREDGAASEVVPAAEELAALPSPAIEPDAAPVPSEPPDSFPSEMAATAEALPEFLPASEIEPSAASDSPVQAKRADALLQEQAFTTEALPETLSPLDTPSDPSNLAESSGSAADGPISEDFLAEVPPGDARVADEAPPDSLSSTLPAAAASSGAEASRQPPIVQRRADPAIASSPQRPIPTAETPAADAASSETPAPTDSGFAADDFSIVDPGDRAFTEVPDSWSSIEDLLNQSQGSESPVIQRFVSDENPAAGVSSLYEATVPPTAGYSDLSSLMQPTSTTTSTETSADEPTSVAQETSGQTGDSANGSAAGESADELEALARAVYSLLRQRLEIERERHGDIYWGRSFW